MKNRISLISRVSAVAVLAGFVCAPTGVFAQSKAADPPEDAPPVAKTSMAPVGAKPSKAELEKQKAAGGGEEAAATTTATTGTKKEAKTTTAGGRLSSEDERFVTMAAKGNMEEIQMGQMAAQHGQSAEVKKMGGMIAADHKKAQDQLMQIAEKMNVKPRLPKDQMKMSKKDMANFDQAWIGMMINDHQKEIAVFERQAQQGADADLKAYAKKTLPVLRKHLKMVQAAQKKMGSGATAPKTTGTTGAGQGTASAKPTSGR